MGAHRADEADRREVPTSTSSLTVPSAAAMRSLGARLALQLRAGDLVVLSGDLGAGKTTLTQGIGVGLGVREGITSPTFVIARVHPSLVGGAGLVHVDAFRLGSLAEVDDLDLDASLADSVTVVEWGHGLVEDLAPDRLEVIIKRLRGDDVAVGGGPDRLALDEDEVREVEIVGYGARWEGAGFPTFVG